LGITISYKQTTSTPLLQSKSIKTDKGKERGEKLSNNKKIATIILAVTFGLSIFVGLVFALRQEPANPNTQILQILQGIQTTVNDIKTSPDTVSDEQFFSYSGQAQVDTPDSYRTIATVSTNKTALFTVSYQVSWGSGNDQVWAWIDLDKSDALYGGSEILSTVKSDDAAAMRDTHTLTFAAESVDINVSSITGSSMVVWSITVQCSSDTSVTSTVT